MSKRHVEGLERRRLLAFTLPSNTFAQADDTYTMAITPVTGTPIAATPITGIAWGLTYTAGSPVADAFVVTLPSGTLSPTLFNMALTAQPLSLVRIDEQTAAARLRARWDINLSAAGAVNVLVRSFSQSIGVGGFLYDSVSFSVPRMINSYFVPNPAGGADVATTQDFNIVTNSGTAVPALSANEYMSTAIDVPTTIEFARGQMPLTSFNFAIDHSGANPTTTGADFTAVASVDAVPLWGRVASASNIFSPVVVTARDDQARPTSRTRFGNTSAPAASSILTRYSFSDTTLDSAARLESYHLIPRVAQSIGYSYNSGTGAMNTPVSSGWDFVLNVPFNPTPFTAFIQPPTSGPRNTPLASVNIQFVPSIPSGSLLSNLLFENLVSAGLTVSQFNGSTYTVGNLAPQQTVDGDYAVKLFAIGSTFANLIGSTGIKWTLDTTAPVVAGRFFDYDITHALFYDFSEDVGPSLTTSDLTIQNLTNNTTIPTASIAREYLPTSARFTFPGLPNGILPDGNYRATLGAAGVTDLVGNPLTANNTLDFFVLAGDVNHDRTVNFDDLLILAQNYGKTARTFSEGNINYSPDGLVGFDDLLILAQRYGTSLLSETPSRLDSKRRSNAADVLS